VLIDRFLDDAIEIDVDALFDGRELYLGGVMEHIEEAGIHSGDSACSLPPVTLGAGELQRVRAQTEAIARGIGVRGLLNIQFALAAGVLYVLEANPRASRTVPFVSKATGVAMAKACARVMLGASIAELRAEGLLPAHGDGGTLPEDTAVSVKEAVLPFKRFITAQGKVVDSILGPEMTSRGPSASPSWPPTAGCRPPVGCSCRSPTATSGRSSFRSSGWSTWVSRCWPPQERRQPCAATGFTARWFANTPAGWARTGNRRS
jgi:hypothetical protein